MAEDGLTSQTQPDDEGKRQHDAQASAQGQGLIDAQVARPEKLSDPTGQQTAANGQEKEESE